MQQYLVWKPLHHPGVEHLRLNIDAHGVHASSQLMQSLRGHSIAASYGLKCDPHWQFQRLWMKVDASGQRSLDLQRDGGGNWTHNGRPRPDLAACQDVMLSASPFTHTPALRRCALRKGQRQVLQVAYVDLLTLDVEARSQAYQCLGLHAGTHRYLSEPQDHASSELTLDPEALLMQVSDQYLRLSARQLDPTKPQPTA
ncbi:MAG: putative glycolipid-binding domain-containing protein [Pseudomonas sp.]|uniref:putative glycolipid-binding domain-containing protein n=1 Tax=Pseudomonas sp. TaxID=306 RepID=UPI003392E5E6